MRTNVEIDDDLLGEAMKVTGKATKRAVLDHALRELVLRHRRRKALDDMRGMGWEGNLEEMRNDWTPEVDWGLDRR